MALRRGGRDAVFRIGRVAAAAGGVGRPAPVPAVRLGGPAAVSVAAHLGLAALALLWWLPVPQPDEVPASIQVLFGEGAQTQGAPAPAAASRPDPVLQSAAADPDGSVRAGGSPAVAAGPAATPLPVRLGEGDVGLKLSEPPDAGLIEAQSDPGNRGPRYPDIAWRQHQRGRVVIRMHIDRAGRVAQAEVLQSSGYPILDRAAREALSAWHFIPALRDGVAVPSFRDQATNFVLE